MPPLTLTLGVAGASGLVGSNLVKAALAAGHSVPASARSYCAPPPPPPTRPRHWP